MRIQKRWCLMLPDLFLPKTINYIQQLWCHRGFVGTPRCWLLIFVSSMTHMPSYAHVTKSGWHHPIDIPIYLGHLGTSSFPLNWLSILFLRENGRKSRQSDLQDMHGGFLGALTLNSAQTLKLSPWMLQMPRASTMQLRNTWTEDQQTQIYGSEAVEWTQSADSASQKKETHHVKTLKLQGTNPIYICIYIYVYIYIYQVAMFLESFWEQPPCFNGSVGKKHAGNHWLYPELFRGFLWRFHQWHPRARPGPAGPASAMAVSWRSATTPKPWATPMQSPGGRSDTDPEVWASALHLWKMMEWVRQLGWWNSQYMEK